MGSLGEIIRTKYYHNYTRENQWHSYSKSLNILDSRTNHSFRLKKAKWQKETKKPILYGMWRPIFQIIGRSAASHRYRNPAENHSYENTSAVRRLFGRTQLLISKKTKTLNLCGILSNLSEKVLIKRVTWFYWKSLKQGTQRQFSQNICSEDDLRSRIFGTFVVKFLACLPLLRFSNI